MEAPHQQHGIDGKAERQADPHADRAPAGPERQRVAAGESDAPEADGREQQRHARVVQAAQRAGGNRLHAVGDEEAHAEQQQRRRQRGRLRRAHLARAEEGVGDHVSRQRDQQRHGGHERGAERDGGEARPSCASGIAPRPAAWPTRTVAAIEMPNGTMNMMAAVCSAIWCAASAVVRDHAHQQGGGREHAELQHEGARDRRAHLEQLGKQRPVRAPEAARARDIS